MRPLGGRIPPDGAFLAARILSDGWTAELDFENISAGSDDPTKVSGQITLPSVDIIGVPMSGTRTLAGVTSNINPWYDSDWPFPSQAVAGGVLTIPVRLDQPVRDTDVVTISVTAGIVTNARAGTVTATNSSTLQHLKYVENQYTTAATMVAQIDCATGCRKTTGFSVPGVTTLPTPTGGSVSWNGTDQVTITGVSAVTFTGWDFRGVYTRTSGTCTNVTFVNCLFDSGPSRVWTVAPVDFFTGNSLWSISFCTFAGTTGASSVASVNTRVQSYDGGTFALNLCENWPQDPISLCGGSSGTHLAVRCNWSKSGGFLVGAHFDCLTLYAGYADVTYNLLDQRTYGTQYGLNNYTRIGGVASSTLSSCTISHNAGIGKVAAVAGYPFQSAQLSGSSVSNISVTNNAFVPLDDGSWYHPTEDGIIACSGNYDPFDNIALPNIPPF